MNNGRQPNAAMKSPYDPPRAGNTLVSDILPTLVKHYANAMNPVSPRVQGALTIFPAPEAEKARLVFEALTALEREQKIRGFTHIMHKTMELFGAIKDAGHDRNWKLVGLLMNLYFAELSTAPSLAVVCKIAVEQEEIQKGADPAAIEKLHAFHKRMLTLLVEATQHEINVAESEGRERLEIVRTGPATEEREADRG